MVKAALAHYATRQAAQEIAERLKRDGFVLRLIATPHQDRIISGSTMGWCALSSHKSRTRLFTFLNNLFARLNRSLTSADLLGFGIPLDALGGHPASRTLNDYVVIVAGSPGLVQRGVWTLKAHQELLKLDLY